MLRPGAAEPRAPDQRAAAESPSDATRLLAAMGYDPVSIDTLVARTGASAQSITAELVTLELDGSIAALPGGYWQRLGPRERAGD